MVIPDDNLVPLLLEDEDNDVCLIHHFDEANGLADLDLLLKLCATRVILNDLEALVRRDCEIFLGLVRGDGVDSCLSFRVGIRSDTTLLLFRLLCLSLLLQVNHAEGLDLGLVNHSRFRLHNIARCRVLHFIIIDISTGF